MPNSILVLILAAVALLAFFDVVLGQCRPGDVRCADRVQRIGLREFATRPLPIFLFGIGAAMLPARPWPGALLLVLAAGLALFGRCTAPSAETRNGAAS